MTQNFTPLKPSLGNEDPASQQEKTSFSPMPEAEPIPLQTDTEAKTEHSETQEQEKVTEKGEIPVGAIEEVKDEIKLDPELKKAGLQVVDKDTLDVRYKVHLPISDQKVYEGLQESPKNSLRWLAELCRLLLLKAHLQLKQFHGKIVRVIQK